MRRLRLVFFLLIGLAFWLAACGGPPSVSAVLKDRGITEQSISGYKIEIRYLKESKGVNYKRLSLAGDEKATAALLDSLQKCEKAEKPEDARFSPELISDCEIVFTDGNGTSVSFYYAARRNLIIFPNRTKEKDKVTLEYLYYTPGAGLDTLVRDGQKSATLTVDAPPESFHSMEELKASIDPYELAEDGTDIDFEFFAGKAPAEAGTACRVYTNKEASGVPEDCYLIAAYGKTAEGKQEKLPVQGMQANANYTKIVVDEPDTSLDSVDTGDSPAAYAILVKKDALDPKKWIVFVDGNDNIFDVILPEDLPR